VNVAFFTPPAEQRVGGLDAALDGLRQALTRHGITVTDQLPADRTAEAVAHFHGLWQRPHLRLARDCRARGIPYVVSPHGMLEPWAWRHKWWKKWPYYHLVEKRHLSRANALLATATAEARRLREFLPAQRIETLPLGLTSDARPDYENARAQLGWHPRERVLLFLSRLHVKKGLDLLLRALATMTFPAETRLVIVGDGEESYVRTLRQLAAQNAASLPPIEWIGAIWGDARWPYFQGADLFCLPTHSENFGLAILEACQVGTPVLTTNETPWAEDLAASRGFIAKPTVESIRQLLATFFAQPPPEPAARHALSEWARSKFHWDTLSASYATFYRSLLNSQPTARVPRAA
jgi:glycosyltransferase involved in cell wall biosynthesis